MKSEGRDVCKQEILNSREAGFGLVEIVVGTLVIVLITSSLYGFFVQAIQVEHQTVNTIRANYLLLEAVDAVRILRDDGWNASIGSMATDTPYYIYFDSGSFVATTTPLVIDGLYHRYVELSDVFRDGSDDIASSGTYDVGSRKVVASIAWMSSTGTTTELFDSYIFNIYGD